jgi:KDO2-lipid IV(A) lauroyltransferase
LLGLPASPTTLRGRLVQPTAATQLLLLGVREPWVRGYRVRVLPWQGELPTGPEAAATQVNAQMERLVRAGPGQYLWGYARYKQPRQELAP